MFPGGRPQNMHQGRQVPVVQYPGMYYSNPSSTPSWLPNTSAPVDAGRDLLADSYERMRNEMRSLQENIEPAAPPPPSMDSSKDNVAIKMLLNNDNVSLSSLLEAAMDPGSGSNKGTEDPVMKKTILDKCEGKIAQLYRHRISGMGTFFPIVPPKGTKANSSSFLTFHHPRIGFNMADIGSIWNCPEVNVEVDQKKKISGAAAIGPTAKPNRNKSPALEAAEEYANKPNPLEPTNTVVIGEPRQPTPSGQIPVIGPVQKVPMVDLTIPPPQLINSIPEPPSDPYATTAFELWAEIERERRHKEKMKEWDLLNEKHKEKEERKKKKKKKRHKHGRSRSSSRSKSRRRSRSLSSSRSRSRHGERRWRSRSRRSRSIYLSPSPTKGRSRSPRHSNSRRYSCSPHRSSSRHRKSSPRRKLLITSERELSRNPRLSHNPLRNEWPAGSHCPLGTNPVSPTPEYYRLGYPEGSDVYHGNNRPSDLPSLNTIQSYPPYSIPSNQYVGYPSYPPRGYPMGGQPGGPQMWGPRVPHTYGYHPPPVDVGPSPPGLLADKPKTANIRSSRQNLREVPLRASPYKWVKSVDGSQKQDCVIVLDDDNEMDLNTDLRKGDSSIDHPPGVSPERELPVIVGKKPTEKESEFTKPMRDKFREMLKPFEKVLNTLKTLQRDSFEHKTLIKGLEIGTCEFDGVYTLIDGILCRVVIDAVENKKTCFKIVLSPIHVSPLLLEIHKAYHDYSSAKIKRAIDEMFYDCKNIHVSKINNIIAVCKQCKAERAARRKENEERGGAQRKSSEKEEGTGDKESQSKSNSRRQQSENKSRGGKKKDRRDSKDDRKDVRDRSEKGDRRHGRKLDDASQKDGEESSKKFPCSSKQKPEETEDIEDSSDQNKVAEIESPGDVKERGITVKKNTVNKLEVAKSVSSVKNISKLPIEKKDVHSKSTENLTECPKAGSGPERVDSGLSPDKQKPEVKPVEPSMFLKNPLVPYVVNKYKPEDFKLRVRSAQLSVEDLKTLIIALEGPDNSSADPSYLLKAGMLCKRVPTDDNKTEVKIAVTPQTLLKMIQIVHTMAATHAPLEKTITVFNKHFTPIRGVQEAVSIVLNNCEQCKSS